MIKMSDRTERRIRTLNDRFKDNLDSIKYITTQKTDTHFLCSYYENYYELSMYELFLNKNEKNAIDYLNKAINANDALYKIANSRGEEIKIFYEGIPEAIIKGQVIYNHITPWNFPDHFCLILLARKKNYLNEMLNFDIDNFNPEKAGLSGPAYYNNYIKIFINFFRIKKTDILLEEMEKCNKEITDYAEVRGKKVEDNYSYSTILLFKAILEKDSNTANQLLEKRLILYKNSYEDDLSNPLSLYPYHLLGWCAFLNDIGMEITIQSDYLPEFLVKGTFTKEKWTWPMG